MRCHPQGAASFGAALMGFLIDHLLDDPVPWLQHRRTQRYEVSVGRSSIVHGDEKEAGEREGFRAGGQLLEVAAERFLALIDAEQRLETRPPQRAVSVSDQ